ncbi:hypothetical protein ACVXHB_31410 [Escherichia coli]
MRNGFNGLGIESSERPEGLPFSGHLFIFRGRRG